MFIFLWKWPQDNAACMPSSGSSHLTYYIHVDEEALNCLLSEEANTWEDSNTGYIDWEQWNDFHVSWKQLKIQPNITLKNLIKIVDHVDRDTLKSTEAKWPTQKPVTQQETHQTKTHTTLTLNKHVYISKLFLFSNKSCLN